MKRPVLHGKNGNETKQTVVLKGGSKSAIQKEGKRLIRVQK